MNSKNKKIVLVDDDAVFLNMLKAQLLEHGILSIDTFPTGEKLMEHLKPEIDLIILDFHLNGIDRHAMNGLETLDKIKTAYPEIPVIMLSSQDKIDVAISCMHHGAFDYIVKSETAFFRVQQAISKLFDFKKIENELNWYMKRM